MKKVRITAIRKACYPDLMEKYENPIQHACDVKEGQVWIANGWAKPEGFCNSAWDSIVLWNCQQQFLRKERKLMTVMSCPKCGILKQGVPEDLDEFADEILDEM